MSEAEQPINPAPPAVDLMTDGGTLRFGAGDPEGRRSASWSVMVGPNRRDIYISPRAAFKVFKLSLHESGRWRFGYTEEWAREKNFPPDRDRVIKRYDKPAEVAPGWRVAAAVMIPESSLSTRSKPESRKVTWWPAPESGHALMFQVWITDSAEADEQGLTIPQVGCAGSFFMPGGGSLYLIADIEKSTENEEKIQYARWKNYESNIANDLPIDDDFYSYGLGGRGDVDIPFLVDLGNLSRLLGNRPIAT